MGTSSNLGGGPLSPTDFVHTFKQNAVNFHNLWKQTGVPPGVQHTTPSQTPITDAQLPSDVLALVDDHRKSHPNVKVTWEKWMQVVDGEIKVVVEDERDVPTETTLLTVSRTISLNTSDTAHVITDVFVGSLG